MSRIRPADLTGLKAMGCDALVVAGYPWLVKGWEGYLPYAVNFHPSPLPEGRGPYPLFQAILDRRDEWGMSVHALSPSFDTGAVVVQDRFALAPDETHDTLLAKCQMAAKRLSVALARDLPRLWTDATPQADGSYWPRVTERQRTLDFTQDVAMCCEPSAPSGPSRPWRRSEASGSMSARQQGGPKRTGTRPAPSSTNIAATWWSPRATDSCRLPAGVRSRRRARARPGGSA